MCGGGGILKALAPVAGAVLGSVLLPGVGTALGTELSSGLGGALGGALAGGLTSGPEGALLGGAGGYFGGPAISGALGAGGEAAAGAAGAGATDALQAAPAAAAGGGALGSAAAGAAPAAAGGDILSSLEGANAALPTYLSAGIPVGSAADIAGQAAALAPGGLPVGSAADLAYQAGTGFPADVFGSAAGSAIGSTLSSGSSGSSAGAGGSNALGTTPGNSIESVAPSLSNVQAGSPTLSLPAAPTGGAGAISPLPDTAPLPPPLPESRLPGADSGVLDFLKRNQGWLQPAIGLAGSALTQPKIPQLSNLQGQANLLGTTASNLVPSVTTGQLPAGAENIVQQATDAAKANIRSKYASLGLSGSSMEAQDLAAADERASGVRFQFASQLTTQGLDAAQMANQAYTQIANLQLQQDQGLQNALSNFAAASALGAGINAAKSVTA